MQDCTDIVRGLRAINLDFIIYSRVGSDNEQIKFLDDTKDIIEEVSIGTRFFAADIGFCINMIGDMRAIIKTENGDFHYGFIDSSFVEMLPNPIDFSLHYCKNDLNLNQVSALLGHKAKI